jgi:Fe-S-cluster containining protein
MHLSESITFYCKLLGTCCTHNQVSLTPYDIFILANHLEVPANFLYKNKLLSYIINKNDYWMEPVINLKNEICPFLFFKNDSERICEIHESRPTVCRIYPLNYNIENNSISISENAKERCRKCFDTDEKVFVGEYIVNSELEERIIFYKDYIDFKKVILHHGFTLQKIKGKPIQKKNFFKIQEILYEKYPNQYFKESVFPWEEMKQEILDVIEFG